MWGLCRQRLCAASEEDVGVSGTQTRGGREGRDSLWELVRHAQGQGRVQVCGVNHVKRGDMRSLGLLNKVPQTAGLKHGSRWSHRSRGEGCKIEVSAGRRPPTFLPLPASGGSRVPWHRSALCLHLRTASVASQGVLPPHLCFPVSPSTDTGHIPVSPSTDTGRTASDPPE